MSQTPLRDFWHSPARLNRLAGLLMAGSVIVLVALVMNWLANRPAFVVKRVIVDSMRGELKHISAPQIHAAIAEALNGTVLSTDLGQIHRALQSIPWIRTVTVRRIWPNRLLVRIQEQRAVATWPNGRLVNDMGELFAGLAADHEDDCILIPLAGPAGSERLVLERARQLASWVGPTHRALQRLTLSEQYAWTAELSGGMVLELGRDTLATPVEERVRMFVKTQPWLAQKLGTPGEPARVAKADLRYATGYAFLPATSSVELPKTALAGQRLCIGDHT